MSINTTRRDGFYEITAPGRYFEASRDFQRGGWVMREWFGPVSGWSPKDHFDTLRECKDEVSARA